MNETVQFRITIHRPSISLNAARMKSPGCKGTDDCICAVLLRGLPSIFIGRTIKFYILCNRCSRINAHRTAASAYTLLLSHAIPDTGYLCQSHFQRPSPSRDRLRSEYPVQYLSLTQKNWNTKWSLNSHSLLWLKHRACRLYTYKWTDYNACDIWHYNRVSTWKGHQAARCVIFTFNRIAFGVF